MATLIDWQTRKARLDSQITQLTELVNMYEQNTRATGDILKTIQALEEKVGDAQNRIQNAEASAATFDREFIERKQTFPDPFYPSKLGTMQDFVTFFFFISYAILTLALSLTLPNGALQVILVAAFLGILIFGMIFTYA